jgi:hypothetical protein
MSRRIEGFRLGKWGLLAWSVLILGAAPLQAAWLGFRNDLKVPVIVRTNTVVKNQVKPGKSALLYPGEVAWEAVLQAGDRQIVIVEARRPNWVLFQDNVTVNKDSFFSIQLNPPNKVKLVPTKMPAVPKQRPMR